MGGTFEKLLDFVRLFFGFSIHPHTQSLSVSGMLFLKRFKDAFTLSAQQSDVFNQFSATFSPSAVKKWEKMVVAWNANPKSRNPYQDRPSGKLFLSIPNHFRV